ncbi:MAG: hypothetical protein Q9227_007898 [Pyrenula ochraceoflavens]
MDPVSILSLVEVCAGLSMTAGKLAVGIRDLASKYKNATATFKSLSLQCKLFSSAVRDIQTWMENGQDSHTLDESVQVQLMDSLQCADEIINALESELFKTSGGTIKTFWEKANVTWNLTAFKELEDSIHKQITGLMFIFSIMNLKTTQKQVLLLTKGELTFNASRSSAMSVRAMPGSITDLDETASTSGRSTSTLQSRMTLFDFDEILMDSPVYQRNRHKVSNIKRNKDTLVPVIQATSPAGSIPRKLSNALEQDPMAPFKKQLQRTEQLQQVLNAYKFPEGISFESVKNQLSQHKVSLEFLSEHQTAINNQRQTIHDQQERLYEDFALQICRNPWVNAQKLHQAQQIPMPKLVDLCRSPPEDGRIVRSLGEHVVAAYARG